MTNKNFCAMGVMLLLVYGALLPLIITNYNYGRAFSDQRQYYYPTILYFSQHFGRVNITNYPSSDVLGFVPPATIPGYYLFLAMAHKWLSPSELALKVINSLFTAAFFLLAARILSDKLDMLRVVTFCLPALCSLYIHPAGVWLLPDNLSCLIVAVILYFLLHSSRGIKNYLLTAALLSVAVFIRQTNIWLALPILVAGCNFPSEDGATIRFDASGIMSAVRKLLPPLLSIVPALGILLIFFLSWHGLVPPALQERHQGINLTIPAFFLSLFFTFSAFYLPYIWARLRPLSRRQVHFVISAFLLGLLLALIAPTDYSYEQGRVSGLWNIVKIAPVYANRSALITCLSPLGAAAMAICLLLVGKRPRWILLAGVVGFVLVNMANKQAFERFYDGFIFIFLVFFSNLIWEKDNFQTNILQIVLPSVLTLYNLLVLVRALV